MKIVRNIYFIKTYRALFLILSLFILSSIQVSAQKQFRIISYNILEGMKMDSTKGKTEFVDWVKAQDPDILALEECNKFTQLSLEEMAHRYGHPYALIVKETGYPTGITSKYPIVNARKITDNMTHGFIVAQIKDLIVIVLHLNPHNYQKRREEIDVILSTIAAAPSQKKWIMMGDFNSFSPLDKENYADGKAIARLKQGNEQFHHNNLVDGQFIDYDVQKRILDFGFKDTGKTMDKENKVKGNRIDYIYVSKDLIPKVTTAHFIRDGFTANHSDHKPVIMEFKH